MNLIEAQAELQDKSKEARKKRNRKNGSSPKKKQTPRARVSVKTQLIELVQDPRASGPTKLEALKMRLWVEGKLTFEQLVQLTDKGLREEVKIEEPKPEPVAPELKGSDLAPARPV